MAAAEATALPALGRGADGEECDQVAPVGVQTEVVVRLLAVEGRLPPHLCLDVAERQPEPTRLGAEAGGGLVDVVAEVGAEAQVHDPQLLERVVRDRHPLEHGHPSAILEFLGHRLDELRRLLQLEVVLADTDGDIAVEERPALHAHLGGLLELREVLTVLLAPPLALHGSEPRHEAGPPSFSNAGADTYAGDVEKARRIGAEMADERERRAAVVRIEESKMRRNPASWCCIIGALSQRNPEGDLGIQSSPLTWAGTESSDKSSLLAPPYRESSLCQP